LQEFATVKIHRCLGQQRAQYAPDSVEVLRRPCNTLGVIARSAQRDEAISATRAVDALRDCFAEPAIGPAVALSALKAAQAHNPQPPVNKQIFAAARLTALIPSGSMFMVRSREGAI
jgi:hypothetical protein